MSWHKSKKTTFTVSMISTGEWDRMEEGTSFIIKKKLYHIPLLCMKFMVSVGVNPIT
jgi:hypothetical protein